MNKGKTKFLIIRFSSIGDVVLTTPVIRNLKNQFNGEIEIHYLTKKTFFPILEHNPYIDKLVGIDKQVSEIKTELIAEQYDFIIDLHKNLRTLKVKRMLQAPSFSFDKINIEKWLMVNLKINRLPAVHIVDRYLDTLNCWNIKNDEKGLDYFLGEEDTVKNLPDFCKKGYVAISTGAAHATKALPREKMRELCEGLGLPIVLLGGKEDIDKASFVADGLSDVYNACGKYTISQSAWILKNAQVVISHDTGLMHIASAFNKPIISLWGNTLPEFGMYPYMPGHPENSKIFEIDNLKCRPCSKLGFNKCPKKHFKCMNEINLSDVISKVLGIYNKLSNQ